jgi:protein-disulfide isomerase
MKQKTVFITALVVLAALFAVSIFAYRTYQEEQGIAASQRNRETLQRMHSPALGRAEAGVQIVEFFDPACETCAAFYPMVKKLMAEHREDIRLVVRYAPLHQGSDEVVKALEASRRQGKFWQALEALLGSQSEWVQHHQARPDRIWPVLARAGLDIERVKADMQSPEVARVIAQDVADARKMNVTKTPEFFVNGRPLPSFGFDQLQALVAEELAAARKARPAQP